MKKIQLLKRVLTAVCLLGGVVTAKAAPSDIMGEYTFSADVTYGSGVSEESFPNTFSFTINENSEFNPNPTIRNFVYSESKAVCTYDPSTGSLVSNAWQYISGTYDDIMAGLSDESGETDYSDYKIQWTVNDDGSITIPNFTAVNKNGEILATYTNAKAIKIGGEEDVPSVIPGNYVVYAYKEAGETYELITFNMSIDDNGYLTAFAGYDNIENSELGNAAGIVRADNYLLAPNTGYYFKLQMDYSTGASEVVGSAYNMNYEKPQIKLTYDVDTSTWTLSDFTVWNQPSPVAAPSKTDLVATYFIVLVLKEGETNPYENFSGTNNISGWWTADYSNYSASDPIWTVESEVNFDVVINNIGQLTSIAGYNIPEQNLVSLIDRGTVSSDVWSLVLNKSNSTLISYTAEDVSNGDTIDGTTGMAKTIIGGAWDGESYTLDSSDFDFEATLDLTYDAGSYKLSDFTIWNVTYSLDDESSLVTSYSLGYVYSSTELSTPQIGFPEAEQLVGTYTLSATVDIKNASYEGKIEAGEFELTYDGSNYLFIEGFLGYGSKVATKKYDQATGVLTLNSSYNNDDDLYFSDAEGDTEPWNLPDLVISFDANGNATMDDFSIVAPLDDELIALISNVVITKNGGLSEDTKHNFANTYKISGTKVTYENGVATDYAEKAFTLLINEDNQLMSIAGYTDLDQLQVQPVTYYERLTNGLETWNMSYYDAYVQIDKVVGNQFEGIVLGGRSTSSYQNGDALVLEYDPETEAYNIGNFTIWKQTIAGVNEDGDDAGYNYTLLYAWQSLTVTPGLEAGDEDDVDKPSGFTYPLEITMTGTKTTASSGAVEKDATFTIEIVKNANGDLVLNQFAGYEIEVPYSSQIPQVTVSGDVFTIQNSMSFFLYYDGDETAYSYSPNMTKFTASPLTLSYKDGKWGLTDFAVYSEFDTDGKYRELDTTWTNLSGLTTDVKSIDAEDLNAPVVYYNLQGQKVNNPEKGFYIRVQGNKTTKIIL